MQRQSGLTLISLVFLLALVAGMTLVAFRIVPAYMDYYTVKSSLENLLAQSESRSNEALRTSFARRLDVNFIRDIDARDLEINTEDGVLTLSVPIRRKSTLVGGVSVCVDLEAKASVPIK